MKFLKMTAPFFAKWSRSMLKKLLLSMKPITVYKDKILCKEGEKSNFFYLIKEGEFELVKRVSKPNSNENDSEAYMKTETALVKDKTHEIDRNN